METLPCFSPVYVYRADTWAPLGMGGEKPHFLPQAAVNLIQEQRWLFSSQSSGDLTRAKQLPSGLSFKRQLYGAKPSPHFPKTELLRRGRGGGQ